MNNNIFINCPYDDKYKGLFNAIIFTIVVLGFSPQVTLQKTDSSDIRMDKIINLIEKSIYSIHDLSRFKAEDKNEYYRLNMPFELGIDYGAKKFNDKYKSKKFLILEKEKYSYRIAISDISGMDIEAHDNNAAMIIMCIRNWLVKNANIINVPAPKKIVDDYLEKFVVFLFRKARKLGYHEDDYIDNITYIEYLDFINEWLTKQRTYKRITFRENNS